MFVPGNPKKVYILQANRAQTKTDWQFLNGLIFSIYVHRIKFALQVFQKQQFLLILVKIAFPGNIDWPARFPDLTPEDFVSVWLP